MEQDKYVDTKNLRLHYLEWGKCYNQPMLLLHGFLGHAHMWDAFSLEFKNYYHILALDQRGHGESQWSKEEAYSIDTHLADIAEFTNILGLDDLILIGHSMGGRNALLFAVCFPERIDRFILIDSCFECGVRTSNALRNLVLQFPRRADSLFQVAESIQSLYRYVPAGTAYHIAEYGYRKSKEEGYVAKFDPKMRTQCEKSRYHPENMWPFLKNVSCCTLLVRGKESPFFES